MRAGGVENTRSKELLPMGGGYQVELVDITILFGGCGPDRSLERLSDPTRRLSEASGEAMDRLTVPRAAAYRSGRADNHTLKDGKPCAAELQALFARHVPFSALGCLKRRIETDADQGVSGVINP